MFKVTIDVLNPASDSVYSKLKARLEREPTNNELRQEVNRILSEGNDLGTVKAIQRKQ